MANRTKTVPGTLSLSEIQSVIRFEEAKSLEFLGSTVSGPNNEVEFRQLTIGNIPSDLTLILTADPVPGKIWNGKMIVGGLSKDVTAWR